MKILIYGSQGWIGNQFIDILKNKNVDFMAGKSRADNHEDIIEELHTVQPTHVISFIGRTHGVIDDVVYPTIDYLEQSGKLVENIRDNLFSPVSLAMACKQLNIHFTYLGTGCIFTYDENHTTVDGFSEDSSPNFFGSSYSIVKGFTDRMMKLFNKDCLNLRIRMPINDEKNGRNFISKITSYKKICSIENSMSVLPTLLPLVLDMMIHNRVGTMNLTNPGYISHNEILTMYKEIVDPNFTWNTFSQAEQRKILASERSNNYLDTSRLIELYPNVPTIKDAVRSCLLKYPIPTLNVKNILVTGGCGFIGSHFINHMLTTYANIRIINIDAMYYCASEDNIDIKYRASDCTRYELIKANILEEPVVTGILVKYNIDSVVHFAAQSHVQNSFSDSVSFSKDNVLGTNVLLECCRVYGKLDKFIHVSTDEVYGESMLSADAHKKTEHTVLCPTNPYAATKAGAELLAQSYLHSFDLPVIITRGNNVYGRNQFPEKLIPKFINQLQNNQKVTIHGDGVSVRAFMHVDDVVKAFEKILLNGVIGEIYNIGCDDNMEFSVMDVAKLLIKQIKFTDNYKEWIDFVEDRPFNDKRYYIDNDKLKQLGWKPLVCFKDGVADILTI